MGQQVPQDRAPGRPAGATARVALETALVTGDDGLALAALRGLAAEPVLDAAGVRERVETEVLAALLAARTGDPERGSRHAAAALSVALVADDEVADLEALARLGIAGVLIAVDEWSEALAELEPSRPRLDAPAPGWAAWCGSLLTARALLAAGRPAEAVAVVQEAAELPADRSDLCAATLRLVEAQAWTRLQAQARSAGDDEAARAAGDAGRRACACAEDAVPDAGPPWFRAEIGMCRAALSDGTADGDDEDGEVLARLATLGAELLDGFPDRDRRAGRAAGPDPGPALVRAARVQLVLARGWWRRGELDRARRAVQDGSAVLAGVDPEHGAGERLMVQVQLLGLAADTAAAAGDHTAALASLRLRLVRAREARAAVARARSAVLARRIGTERALAQAARIRARELRESITHERLATRVAALSQDAEHDPLTGLANRRLLASFLAAAHTEAVTLGQPLVVAVLDVDHFKQVNDRHSHLVGDEVLRRLGELLRRQTRAADLAARLGGEEFVLVLSRVTRVSAASALERIRIAVQDHPWGEVSEGLAVTVSIGACDFSGFDDVDAGLRCADELLYEAKRAGRNRLRVDLHRSPAGPPGTGRAARTTIAPGDDDPGARTEPAPPADPVPATEPGPVVDEAHGAVQALVAEALRLDQAREYGQALQSAQQALALAEQGGVTGRLLVDALVVASLGEALVGDQEQALALASRALAAAQAGGDGHGDLLWPRLALLRAQLQLDDVTGALATLDEVWPDAEQARDWYPRYLCERSFGYLATVTDRPQDAVVWNERALQTARPVAPPARTAMAALEAVVPWVRLGDLMHEQGDPADAVAAWQQGLQACDRAAELVAAADTVVQRFSLAAVHGALLARLGDRAQAWARFDQALDCSAGAWGPHLLIELRVERARSCLAEGRLEAAEQELLAAELLDRAAPEPVARRGILALGADLAERRGQLAEAVRLLREHAAVEEDIALGEAQARTRVLELRRRTEEALREAATAAAHAATLSAVNLELRERTQVLAREALQDPLTGLANRRQLDLRLEQVHAQARAARRPLCLAMIDVDRFKAVNDGYGHDIGDAVLRELARLVEQQLRQGELAARFGGEELVVLFGDAGLAAAGQVCERIRTAVADHDWDRIAAGLRVTVSLGVADIQGHPTPLAGMQHVDTLLYRAKRNGRNQVVDDPGQPAAAGGAASGVGRG